MKLLQSKPRAQDKKHTERSPGSVLCFFALILLLCVLPREAYAAGIVKVPFSDTTGRYLEKTSGGWYLKNRSGKPQTGLQYLIIPKTGDLFSGYYVFDSKGKLIEKQAVYYFSGKKVHGVTFSGYYYAATKSGRLCTGSGSCYRIKKQVCNGKTFDGIYYTGEYGKLSSKARLRSIKKQKVGNDTLQAGCYWFQTNGRLDTTAGFHRLSCTINNTVFSGYYYFGTGGRLRQKEGIVTVDGRRYYVNSAGKRCVNCWKGGHYWLKDGTMAVSMQLPDGQYVDCNGNKCSKNEVALSPLRYQLKNLTAGYGGSWSIYIKDLKTGNVLNLNSTQQMYSASIIKMYCMAAVFDQIENGTLKRTAKTDNYLKKMITVSDNEAFNQLVRILGSDSYSRGFRTLNSYIRKNGYSLTSVHHTCIPSLAGFITDGSDAQNTTCASDAGRLLEKIYKGTCVSKASSGSMLDILLAQKQKMKIPAGLPAGIKTASKTGENTSKGIEHDAAIVYGRKTTYILCVFSENSKSDAIEGIRKISQRVYQYLN